MEVQFRDGATGRVVAECADTEIGLKYAADMNAGAAGAAETWMRDDVLERFVRDYIASVTAEEVVFSWQGGEPTLMGLAFFEKVVELQKRRGPGSASRTTCRRTGRCSMTTGRGSSSGTTFWSA